MSMWKEIKMLVIFPTAFAYLSPESMFKVDTLESIMIVFYYSEHFIVNVTPCFLWAVQFLFGLLCMACSFLKKMNASFF